MEERRKGTRLGLESRLVIKRIDETEDDEIVIDIIDASKSGIGFTCEKELAIGAVYESYLRIWTQEVIHALLEIIRVKKNENLYECGAFFVGMPEIDSSRIDIYTTIEKANREVDDQ